MKKYFILILITITLIACTNKKPANHDICRGTMKKLFYTTEKLDSQALENIDKYIDILAPQCYKIENDGSVSGNPDDKLINLALKYNIPLMPLIINPGFSQEDFHNFLQDQKKQEFTITQMVEICKKNNYYGIQFDFEHIMSTDKELYTTFCQKAAKSFHASGLKFSIAVVPPSPEKNKTPYQQWVYENWSSGYDIKELAKISDFISLMTYDNHTRNTPPGPIAGLSWIKNILSRILKDVPAEKLSLGIPAYSAYWHTNIDKDKKPAVIRTALSYDEAIKMIQEKQIKMEWDDCSKVNWDIYQEERHIYNYLFVEDHDSMQEKLDLITKHNLHGFSLWRIGFEDRKFYDLLSDNRQ